MVSSIWSSIVGRICFDSVLTSSCECAVDVRLTFDMIFHGTLICGTSDQLNFQPKFLDFFEKSACGQPPCLFSLENNRVQSRIGKIFFEVRMYWYVIYTKPNREGVALENLLRQGYECYLPVLPKEKICKGKLTVVEGPLFPRYLFIRLGLDSLDKSWAPIRSTKGVSRMVTSGAEPSRVDDRLIELLRNQESYRMTKPLFSRGERVRLTESPFSDIEGIYQMAEGERRVMVLIELLSKPVTLGVPLASLRKIG